MTPEMTRCITDCHECRVTCMSMAKSHCLEMGGKHTETAHYKLMMDCAKICRECAEICEEMMGEIAKPDGGSCVALLI